MKFILTVIGVITTLFYLILFGILVSKNFVFDGYLVINYDFSKESPFISLLKPRGRIDQQIYKDKDQDYYQKLLVDPVYFDVDLPRSFETAEVTIKYKNPNEPLLELGISSGKDDSGFYLQPMENKLLDKINNDSEWESIRNGKTILYQKNGQFTSIDEFKKNLPSDKKIALYNYYLPISYKINNYKPRQDGLSINKSIRGSHEMYTYVGPGQDLNFNFNFQDVNRGEGEDPIKIEVLYYDRQIKEEVINDDGIADDSAYMSKPFDYNLFIKTPPSGLYKIKIISDDDIFIRQIKSHEQHLLAFINHIYLGDNVGYLNEHDMARYDPTELFTTTEKLAAITAHNEGYQTIKFGDKDFDIDQKHIMFVQSNPLTQRQGWIETIKTQKEDIKVLGKGLFYFDQNHFFDPTHIAISGDPEFDLEKYNIGYIIANYEPPKIIDGWKYQTLKYDLINHSDNDNSYRFAFSFPYSQLTETDILVSDISIKLLAEPIGIKEFFQKTYNQIVKFIKT